MSVPTTFLLLTYNSRDTVAEALAAALAQTHRPLQLIVGDDASSDGTGDGIEDLIADYDGDIDVVLVRHPSNRGLVGNILASLDGRVRGELVVLAAGDDVSEPDRVATLVRRWVEEGKPTPAAIYSDLVPIDSSGMAVNDWTERVARPPWSLARLIEGRDSPIGATCAYTPDLFISPSPLSSAVWHEDRVLPFRAKLFGGAILWVEEPLVRYRVDGGISRDAGVSRFENVTQILAAKLRRMRPDSDQRLADLQSVMPGSAAIRLARQVDAEMQFRADLAEGAALASSYRRALAGGARHSRLLRYLATYARAVLERTMGG